MLRVFALSFVLAGCAAPPAVAPPRIAAPEAVYDPASWNRQMLAQDSTYAAQMAASDLPIRIGAFPVPDYDTPGNGNGAVSVVIDGQRLGGHIAMVGRNAETEVYFGGLAPEASGVVLVAVLVVGGEGANAFATSRNHPVYLAEGRIATPEAGIDWLSLAMPDAPDRLVVNTRVFDLSRGRTVLVAPLADGTLRFLQVDTPPFPIDDLMDMDALGSLLTPALGTPEVRAFLRAVAPRLGDAGGRE